MGLLNTLKKGSFYLKELKKGSIFALAIGIYPMTHSGELAEWSNAAVLKTVEGHTSRGSNPLLSALIKCFTSEMWSIFCLWNLRATLPKMK
jgi:hypothetical protein